MFKRFKQSELKKLETIAGFETEITYKAVRNINLRLKPGNNTIFVSAPRRVSQKEIARFIESKRDWLRQNLEKMRNHQPVKPPGISAGETHFVWGRPLVLQPVLHKTKGRRMPEIDYDLTHLFFPIPAKPETEAARGKRLQKWYVEETQRAVAQMLPYWQERMEVEVAHLSYRSMRSRWGTCFVNDAHIRLNSELAKHPLICLEYVLVHEMVHFFETGHNARFYAFMDRYLPDWRARRTLLNSMHTRVIEPI